MVDSTKSTFPKTGNFGFRRLQKPELIAGSVLIVCLTAIVIAMLIREPRYKPMGGNSKLVLDTHTGETFIPKRADRKQADTTSNARKEKYRQLSQSEIAKIEGK